MASPGTSRDRLLAAAAKEFAARGYEGASVDRIARAARLNKAMIYYHFNSKAGLYRALIRIVFETVLADATVVTESNAHPEDKIRRFVRSVGETAARQPHFPKLWLREFAAGAIHVDLETLQVASRVVATLGRILDEGRVQGVFRPADPLLVHLGIVAPVLLFLAGDNARERLARANVSGVRKLTLERMIEHVTQSTLGSLCIDSGENHA